MHCEYDSARTTSTARASTRCPRGTSCCARTKEGEFANHLLANACTPFHEDAEKILWGGGVRAPRRALSDNCVSTFALRVGDAGSLCIHPR